MTPDNTLGPTIPVAMESEVMVKKCRECGRKGTWVLYGIPFARNPFICGIHARSVPYCTMNKAMYSERPNW